MSAVVYVETNFLVALVFPDDSRHGAAHQLYMDNQADIRLPIVAALEARQTVWRRAQEKRQQIDRAKEMLEQLRETGGVSMEPSQLRKLTVELDSYARRDFSSELERVIDQGRLTYLHLDEAAFAEAQRLLTTTGLKGSDAVDGYILACILRNASSAPSGTPRLFMSTNRKEFASGPTPADKLPDGFYEPYRILYQPHFHLPSAIQQWQDRFGAHGSD